MLVLCIMIYKSHLKCKDVCYSFKYPVLFQTMIKNSSHGEPSS